MDPFAVNKNGDEKICIVGAGLVGSMLSIILAQSGFEIEVFEKRKDPRLDDKTRGRSIAMSISNRGWKALKNNQNILELPDGILLELVEGVLTRKTAETEISA